MPEAESRDSEYVAVRARIEALFASLSPQLRQAARYVLDRPDEVALQSMRRLAANAGVNPATMVRLAQALDYPGFEAFREPYRQRLRGPAARYSARARALQALGRGTGGARPALIEEMLSADLANLSETFAAIGSEGLAAAAETLAGARRIYVAGLRSCYPVAFHFHYACRIFRTDVDLLDGRGGTVTDGLRGIGAEDAMLAVSFSPYTRETVQAANHASKRGAALVAITDSAVSPLATAARHTLLVANDSPSVFQSIVSAIAIAQALAAILAVRGGEDALAAIGESESLLHDFQAYWEETAPWTAPGRVAAGMAGER